MKDFLGIFLMLLLVMTGILLFVFFAATIGYLGMVLLEIIIVTAIILLAIRYIRPRR